MSDRPVAGLVTLAAILPLFAVRVLGPAAVGAFVASLAGWLGGRAPSAILGVQDAAVITGIAIVTMESALQLNDLPFLYEDKAQARCWTGRWARR